MSPRWPSFSSVHFLRRSMTLSMTSLHTDRGMTLFLHDGFLEFGDGPELPWVYADRNLHAVCEICTWKRAPQEMPWAEWWSSWEHCSRVHKSMFDPHHVLPLYVEYNKLVVPKFSLNLNRNLGNDAYLNLGPVFWRVIRYHAHLWCWYLFCCI